MATFIDTIKALITRLIFSAHGLVAIFKVGVEFMRELFRALFRLMSSSELDLVILMFRLNFQKTEYQALNRGVAL